MSEEIDWRTQKGLVRLDVAILAAYLLAARVQVQIVPSFWRHMLTELAQWGVAKAEALIRKAAGAFGWTAWLGLVSVDTIRVKAGTDKMAEDVELVSQQAMRELVGRAMMRGHRRRVAKWVWSRRKTPRQRAPNKSWTNPRAT